MSDFFDKRPRRGDDGAGERGRRRAEARQCARRRRRAALGFVMSALLVAAAAFAIVPMVRGDEPEPRPDHVGKRSAQTDDTPPLVDGCLGGPAAVNAGGADCSTLRWSGVCHAA